MNKWARNWGNKSLIKLPAFHIVHYFMPTETIGSSASCLSPWEVEENKFTSRAASHTNFRLYGVNGCLVILYLHTGRPSAAGVCGVANSSLAAARPTTKIYTYAKGPQSSQKYSA